jgi:hypothetical protein
LHVSNAGTINLGDTFNLGSNANSKRLGGSEPIGDFTVNVDGECNQTVDVDFVDQL